MRVPRDDEAQSVNPTFDWVAQTPAGTQVMPTFVSAPTLAPSDIVKGGETTGDIYFEVGAARGDFFLIFKPISEPFDDSRGVWKVTI